MLVRISLFLPIQRMSEVRIWRYLVFWALKKVKGPMKRVKTDCRKGQRKHFDYNHV